MQIRSLSCFQVIFICRNYCKMTLHKKNLQVQKLSKLSLVEGTIGDCYWYMYMIALSRQSLSRCIGIYLYIITPQIKSKHNNNLGCVKRIWYLPPMRTAKVQASLRIHAVSLESPLLTHTSSESRGTFRQKARSLALLNGWPCTVKICHDGMLEDTNSLDAPHLQVIIQCPSPMGICRISVYNFSSITAMQKDSP